MMQRNPSRKSYLNGEGFIPHRIELLTSPAWRKRPRPLATILERLEIEHMRHAGKENGNLHVSYDQFAAFGVSRRAINPSLKIGVAIGLVEVIQSDAWEGDVRSPNRYRLTYVPAKGKLAPTDEWSFLDDPRVTAVLAAMKAAPEHDDLEQRETA